MLKNITIEIIFLSIVFLCLYPIFNFQEVIYLNSPILITNSNIKLTNLNLILNGKSDCPLIIIGNEYGEPITNILINNITIDGNRLNQSKELYKKTNRGIINNDGIFIQNCKNVRLSNINIKNCKSGGIVTTLGVDNLQINNLTSENNEYDGAAFYETTNSFFYNISLKGNLAAGISLDNNFNFNVFSNCFIYSNDTAIFIRNSSNNKFLNINLNNNKFGIFMAQVNQFTNTGCINNKFQIFSDKIDCFKVNNKSCTGNEIKIDKR